MSKLLKCFTNVQQGDGFGSQYHHIIEIFLWCKLNNLNYVHNPIESSEHNDDNTQEYIDELNSIMNMHSGDLPLYKDHPYAMEVHYTFQKIMDYMEKDNNRSLAIRSEHMKTLKEMFWKNKEKDFFKNDKFNVALHVRRPNKNDSRLAGADTVDQYYIEKIENILETYKDKDIVFHLYSQGSEEMFDAYKKYSTVLHLNESLLDTFTGMVAGDVLVISASSMSFAAGLLSDGTVYYHPFWHKPVDTWITDNNENNYISPYTLPFLTNDIEIPSSCKNIKIDVGLSYTANHSLNWLDKDKECFVIGFEPNQASIQRMYRYNYMSANIPGIETFNEKKMNYYMDNRFLINKIALSDTPYAKTMEFYNTHKDCGTSSLYKPIDEMSKDGQGFGDFSIDKVPVISLKMVLERISKIRFPTIGYIKIDAQGADLDIIKSAGDQLKERIVWLTAEADGWQYEGANNCTEVNMDEYMTSQGFERVKHPNTQDPTYLNTRFKDSADNIFISQL